MHGALAVFVTVLTVVIMPVLAADKSDVVVFVNGDRLTGEVKSLERGKLRFDTDATGTIAIEWDDVAFLSSDQNIQVETEEGIRHLGNLTVVAEPQRIVVETGTGPVSLDAEQVVQMTPIERSRLERLDVDVTAGYNFAKASQVRQFTMGANAGYRTETRKVSLGYSATTSDSRETEASQRQSLNLDYTRFRQNRWLTGGVLRFDSNDELGLDLRTSLGVGGGRILRQTNSTNLQLTGGLQVSRENIADGPSSEDTLEAFGSLSWGWFRYDTPELDLTTKLQVIPSLTESGRVRTELDVRFRWEIVADLFWQLSFYNSYDSDPVNIDAKNSDYGINTSLGWEF